MLVLGLGLDVTLIPVLGSRLTPVSWLRLELVAIDVDGNEPISPRDDEVGPLAKTGMPKDCS